LLVENKDSHLCQVNTVCFTTVQCWIFSASLHATYVIDNKCNLCTNCITDD